LLLKHIVFKGIVNDLEEIKEICLGERTGRIYRVNETVPVIELRQAKECIYSHIHLPVVVLSANATPEEYATTTKIIATLRTIGKNNEAKSYIDFQD
jgi:DNA primase large subunit